MIRRDIKLIMTLILAFTDIITYIPTLIIVILNGTLVIDILKEKLYNIAIIYIYYVLVHEPYLFCNPCPSISHLTLVELSTSALFVMKKTKRKHCIRNL